MKHDQDAAWRSLCAELRPDDGVPPHVLKKREAARAARSTSNTGGGHRGRQYCKAVQRCLEAALSEEPGDSPLDGLSIDSVTPEPGGAALLVVSLHPGADAAELATREAALNAAAGHMRAAIAGGIRRKRVPHLRFRVVPHPGGL